MAGLRIGIDVGGTFTHGVVLKPPGEVLVTAVTPTTHSATEGVAAGVQSVLSDLLGKLEGPGQSRNDVELVAHSTTQATNALLEGDISPVLRYVIIPPGEGWLVRRALRGKQLDLGGGHTLPIETCYLEWDELEAFTPPAKEDDRPIAVIQPLAGKFEVREGQLAGALRRQGRQVVCASEITEVLGLAARARTATINAAMLPTMLATADYTEQAVAAVLPGVPVQVVRSDGGAMSLQEMRRQPILSLLSGPAAGASAALNATGLSEVVFIEVGGTSTDITLIKDGRVRHRYATVGGHRLMVPALDLRTVAVGGGSMLRSTNPVCGPRSAHIAGLPYAFQGFAAGLEAEQLVLYPDPSEVEYDKSKLYDVWQGGEGPVSAMTLTDLWILENINPNPQLVEDTLGIKLGQNHTEQFNRLRTMHDGHKLIGNTIEAVCDAVRELITAHNATLSQFTLVGGGGGAPCIIEYVAAELGMKHTLVNHHSVISAIGAALAVTCVSLSRSVAEPSGGDIAELTAQVEERLKGQGAERVSTDYEFDSHRQVLTVTGRGSRAYDQDAEAKSQVEQADLASGFLGAGAEVAWQSTDTQLWLASAETTRQRLKRKAKLGRLAIVLDHYGRSLWHGQLREWFAVPAGEHDRVLSEILDSRMQYTDGGAELPGLAYVCANRLIPLDTLGSAELIADVLRWEELPPNADGCFLIRS